MNDIEMVIKDLEKVKDGIEWDSPLEYQIMIDEVIQTIRELENKNDEYEEQLESYGETIDELNEHLTDAFEKIRELQNQIPKWHLVADGDLPNNARQVLVYGMSYHFVIGKYAEMRTEKGYEMKWVTYDAWSYNEELKDVIAWMELPKFKEEK